MDLTEIRRLRLLDLIEEAGSAAELARRAGNMNASIVRRMTYERGRDQAKGIGEESARRFEAAMRKPRYWMDAHPPVSGVSHHLRPNPISLPPPMTWGAIMNGELLPQRFTVNMPDDALAPRVARGTPLIFETTAMPHPGVGVLVEDGSGHRYVRRYAEAAGGAWLAQATNDAYATLHSETDKLQLLAVLTWKGSGEV